MQCSLCHYLTGCLVSKTLSKSSWYTLYILPYFAIHFFATLTYAQKNKQKTTRSFQFSCSIQNRIVIEFISIEHNIAILYKIDRNEQSVKQSTVSCMPLHQIKLRFVWWQVYIFFSLAASYCFQMLFFNILKPLFNSYTYINVHSGEQFLSILYIYQVGLPGGNREQNLYTFWTYPPK